MANNRIAYGLAKEYGINTEGMKPKEVWDALANKGINQGNYQQYQNRQNASYENLQSNEKPLKKLKMGNYVLSEDDELVVKNIKNGDYYSEEELKNLPLFKKMDEVATQIQLDVGKKIGVPDGDTSKIKTPEREKQREQFINDFINGTGNAQTRPNPLNKEFKMTIVVGLPASGKSSQIAEPLSEEQGAFIFDSDEMKKPIPEYMDGANGGGVHKESKNLLNRAQEYFTKGAMKGTNLVYPFIGDDAEKTMKKIQPFIDAGYDVEIAYKKADTVESKNRALMRAVTKNRPFKASVLESYSNEKVVQAFNEVVAKGIKKSKYSEL
jgi:hypothetical protein